MIEINNKTKNKIDEKIIKELAKRFLKYYKLENKEISIAFVGDKTIRELNKKYRKINKVTDVLSFSGEDDFLGEIVIDYAQIKRQARKYSENINEELKFILIHGLLHLIGYEDKEENERKKMEEIGVGFINKMSKL